MNVNPLRWDLTPLYSGLEGEDYQRDKESLSSTAAALGEFLNKTPGTPPGVWLPQAVGYLDRLQDLSDNLREYVYAVWSVATEDETAQGEIDELEQRTLALKEVEVQFRSLLPSLEGEWESLLEKPELSPFRFWLQEQRLLAQRQMAPGEESLAADLQRTGGDSWDRLHGRISSTLSRPWDKGRKTVTELRALAYDPSREIRRRAWREELAAWESMEIPLAACLNGVKGASVSLNKRRGWGSTLECALRQNRLSRTSLDAMLGVMGESLPLFQRYFRAKAGILGLPRLAWYDLFAPVKSSGKDWTWDKTQGFIVEQFGSLEPEFAQFARQAFDQRWFDAEPRPGKVSGAYCVYMPLARESRIMCNFDGSLNDVSTVAHELGHAWHGHVMKDITALNRVYPMTLAETASIFAETLVFSAALGKAGPGEKAGILETWLMGAAQVVVDIHSRFLFESTVLRRRPQGELSPRELKEIMLDTQERTYGDALDPQDRHPYMWAVKGHYYSTDQAFYNYPYAFGLLFALGLFGIFQEEGPAFAERYRRLLQRTGSADAVAVGKSAGFDMESPAFWRKSLQFIEGKVAEFEALVS